ncbi:amino acid transporter ANT1 isoform X2 [Ananas comosus]|uniref:Amino acid transporter ANT1 isoform X2 n=1 Tax=Ananas comosus TaxID=4615 RepID=A0A6P5GT89_ANACO|nr:amino acid transporter ANT1 isoform X2 [Ananas comosus]
MKGKRADASASLLHEAEAEAESESSERGRGRVVVGGSGGGATWAQTLGNIVVSIVGTGVLGLPYAFRIAGWLAGSLGVAAAGFATFYCMLLLVQCRDKLEEEEVDNSTHRYTYGDLGGKAFGPVGRYLTELLILVTQAGGSVAYLVFISHNLSSIFSARSKYHGISPSVFIFSLLLPVEIALSFVRSLSSLAPFSMFADVCNVLAMAIVIKEDLQHFDQAFKSRNAFNGIWGIPFAGGVAVFCFEGFSMTLALEASMAERRKFRWVLAQAFLGITFAYICFGIFGYLAYGDETRDIITLNLPNNWSAAAVKAKLWSNEWFQKQRRNIPGAEWSGLHGSRILAVAVLAVLASFIPGFSTFISFVGSTGCALLSFVLPAAFHLFIMGHTIGFWQRALDYGILITGLAFAGYGTYDVFASHSSI